MRSHHEIDILKGSGWDEIGRLGGNERGVLEGIKIREKRKKFLTFFYF
jgi:hypothetical protein